MFLAVVSNCYFCLWS